MARGEVKYRLTLDAKEFSGGIKVAQKEFEGFISGLGDGAGAVGKVAQAMGPAGMAMAAGIGVATAAVVGFVKVTAEAVAASVEYAGKITDLAAKTHIAAEALQVLEHRGSLVDASLESTTAAISKMQQHLVKAPEDLRQLGLSYEEIKNLKPEEQFETIGAAILSIEDASQRTAATQAFMGKSGAEALKLLSVGADEARESAERLGLVMKDTTRVALDDLGDAVTTLSSTWDHLLLNWGGAIAETPEVREAVEAVTEALGDMSVFVQENADEIQDLIRVAIVPLGNAAVMLVKSLEYVIRGFVTLIQKAKELKAALSGTWLGQAAGIAGGAFLGMGGDSLYGGGGGNSLSASSRAGKPPGWIDPAELKKREAALKKHLDQLDKNMEEFRRNHEKTEAAILQFQIQTHQLATKESENFWDNQIDMAERAGREMLAGIQARQAMEKAIARAWAEEQRRMQEQAVQDVKNMIGAIQGLMAAYQAGQQAGSAGKGALAGAGKGAAAGSAFGPYGIVIGAAIGAVVGGIGGAKARAAELAALNKELTALQKQAEAAGLTLRQTFNRRDPDAYRRAIEQVQEALQLNADAQAALNEAIERYGFTIDELGPRFRQQRMDEMALQLIQDFRLLTASGIDIDVVLQRMGASITEFFHMAMTTGTAIPEAMRPMLEQMIDAGLLLDENGVAFESLEETGVTFAQSMTEQFTTLIQRIDDLVSALLGIPNVTRTVTVVTRDEGGGKNEEREQGYATGGYIPATPGGRSIRVAEGGEGEYVIPESRMNGFGGDVIVYIGGEKLDGVITRRVRSGNIRVS